MWIRCIVEPLLEKVRLRRRFQVFERQRLRNAVLFEKWIRENLFERGSIDWRLLKQTNDQTFGLFRKLARELNLGIEHWVFDLLYHVQIVLSFASVDERGVAKKQLKHTTAYLPIVNLMDVVSLLREHLWRHVLKIVAHGVKAVGEVVIEDLSAAEVPDLDFQTVAQE